MRKRERGERATGWWSAKEGGKTQERKDLAARRHHAGVRRFGDGG